MQEGKTLTWNASRDKGDRFYRTLFLNAECLDKKKYVLLQVSFSIPFISVEEIYV